MNEQPKVLERNGKFYSRKPFAGWTHVVTAELSTLERNHVIHVYTTDPSRENVALELWDIKHESVMAIRIDSMYTEEEDRMRTEMLNDLLKNWD